VEKLCPPAFGCGDVHLTFHHEFPAAAIASIACGGTLA
jgi:hypothetical protein